MKINPNKFGIAGSLTMAGWYVVYAFFAKLWPVQTINFLMATRMMKPLPLARYLMTTPYSFFFGLVSNLIFGYLLLAIIATIYNALQPKEK
ncbi:MAG: DUF5676 family membrane protein [Candidatus Babeliales bacterium]